MSKKEGDNHPKAKLRAADIPGIRKACRVRGGVAREARRYGVHWTTIRKVRDGDSWCSVPE